MTLGRKRWFALGLLGFLGACAAEATDSLDGQGDDVQAEGCAPGAQVACACIDGSTGAQICLPERSFGPCDCAGGPQTAPGCVAGSTASCTCADGSYGAQTCAADGLFGPCACTPAATGGSPSTGGATTAGGTSAGGSVTAGTAGSATAGGGGAAGTGTGGTAGGVSGTGGFTGGTGGITGGAGGTTGGTGGSAGTTGGAGGTATGGTGGTTTGGTGGTTTGGAGGSAGTTGGAGGSGGAPPGVNDPVIPSTSGTCPTFTSGEQTIMGLATDILAGTPGDTKGPLLFTWHGTGSSGGTALNFQLPSSVRNEIVAQGGIIIAPNDDGTTREGSSPNGVWYETSDLEYADHIVACAVQNHNIDPRRIYVTGCSAGGLMAGAMAVKRSNYIAAAAPNSGGLVSTFGLSFQDPSRVPAVLTMHGGSGDTVVVNFQTTSETLDNFITPDGFAVDCNHGSGHCGAPTELHEAAWEFMKAHPFGTSPSPYESGLPASFPSYCTIW